jgi:type IV pilus assembly protein PilE
MKIQDRRGYTLMELVIAILIIGILASFAVPQYLKTIESGKYDDAVGLVNQIGMTNRMFALDHNGFFATGQFTTSNCGCTAGPPSTCQTILATYGGTAANSYTPTMDVANPCVLVCCNYLGDQNWPTKAYNFYACSETGAAPGPCSGNTNPVAGASRTTTGTGSTNINPYKTWGVWMNNAGTIANVSTATSPPNPTY